VDLIAGLYDRSYEGVERMVTAANCAVLARKNADGAYSRSARKL
jgi:hypothetical protein